MESSRPQRSDSFYNQTAKEADTAAQLDAEERVAWTVGMCWHVVCVCVWSDLKITQTLERYLNGEL